MADRSERKHAHHHAWRMPTAAIAADAESGRLVEGRPVGHTAAQRLKHGLGVAREICHYLLVQEAAIAVLQHLHKLQVL